MALGVAGFVVTRLLLEPPPGGRGGVAVLGRALLWGAPAVATVCMAVLVAGLVLLPPADLRNQAATALWTAIGASGSALLGQDSGAARGGELLLYVFITGVAAQLTLGWTVVVVTLRRPGQGRLIRFVAVGGVLAGLAVMLALEWRGASNVLFYLAAPRAPVFLLGAFLATFRWKAVVSPSNRAFRALARLGDIALPFWLWLWPLLLLPRMILARPLQPVEIAGVLMVAVLLAVATHQGIERPLRRRLEGRQVRALAVCGALLGVVALTSAGLTVAQGLPGRASAAVRAEEGAMRVRAPLQGRCNVDAGDIPAAGACTVPTGAKAGVILWGNSHGSHLSPALLDWAGARGHAVRQATRSGCLPLTRPSAGLVTPDCAIFNRRAVREWGRMQPDLILVGAGWSVVLERADGDGDANLDSLDRDLRAMLTRLRTSVGPRTGIVLLGNTPDYGFAPGACHARRAFLRLDTARCDRTRPANAALMAAVDARLARIADETPGVFLYLPSTALCRDGLCRMRGADGPWYSDRSHMTEAGGRAQTSALSAVLDHALASRRGP